jgi:hypothetical protein
MIPKSGYRVSAKIMLYQQAKAGGIEQGHHVFSYAPSAGSF